MRFDGFVSLPKDSRAGTAPPGIDGWALALLALPTLVFVVGWLATPWNIVGSIALIAAIAGLLARRGGRTGPSLGLVALPLVLIATLWTITAGLGHFVYANSDWVVRDAVLRDLVVDRWPVLYRVDGIATLLRAPIGYFLPAALIGRVAGLQAAETALLVWTVIGVALVFLLMMRDRPPLKSAIIRVAIFIVFSGADVLGNLAHYNPIHLGDHLEWWAFIFQYSSQTTQLFWVPNHALPGWLVVAWLIGQDWRTLSISRAVTMLALVPIWSPLTAIGLAPLIGIAIIARLTREPLAGWPRLLFDWRLVAVVSIQLVLVYPYLVADAGKVASGGSADLRWVGEDIVPRIIEFVLFEFAGFAVLLLRRSPRDPLLWVAVLTLIVLPIARFGPANDLAMRASIAPLAYLAISLGDWLSTPLIARRQPVAVGLAWLLLAVGAVTPFMEFARIFIEPAWPMNTAASVVDVTRGTHYLAPVAHPWIERFLDVPVR